MSDNALIAKYAKKEMDTLDAKGTALKQDIDDIKALQGRMKATGILAMTVHKMASIADSIAAAVQANKTVADLSVATLKGAFAASPTGNAPTALTDVQQTTMFAVINHLDDLLVKCTEAKDKCKEEYFQADAIHRKYSA
jgi:hypothetical protein